MLATWVVGAERMSVPDPLPVFGRQATPSDPHAVRRMRAVRCGGACRRCSVLRASPVEVDATSTRFTPREWMATAGSGVSGAPSVNWLQPFCPCSLNRATSS
jgi:hypothetical protein